MRAAILRDRKIVVEDLPDPEPASGQVLVKTLACGICGSDLHAAKHLDQLAEAAAESGAPSLLDPARDVVMGHEFCAEIVDFGAHTARHLAPGTRVCSVPIVFHGSGIEPVGFSNNVPGGYAELMVLAEPMLLPVPDGFPTEYAALTEPMAVGIHAVARARMEEDRLKTALGINKELNLQFCLGYTPDEFASALSALAEGRIDGEPLITGRVGVDGVPDAFETLANPEEHAKILVEPWR